MEQTAKLLTGWKAIENFIGMNRETILKYGYPIRKIGKIVQAVPEELIMHSQNMPLIILDDRR